MRSLFPAPLLALCACLLGACSTDTRNEAARTPASQAPSGPDLLREVDPRIGTGAHGHTFPGPTLPFGMVQPGPDTRLSGWDGCSGYHADDELVYGFSHTHLSGTGVSDYGDVLLMPTTLDPALRGALGDPEHPWAAHFDKRQELASPGYYALRLEQPGIEVELTSTARVGVHRYRFSPTEHAPALYLDLRHRDEVLEASFEQRSPTRIVGLRRSKAWARDQQLYFAIELSAPITGIDVLEAVAGAPRRALLQLDPAALEAGQALVARVAISAVDIAGAEANLEAEAPHADFDAYVEQAEASWRAALGRVVVEGGSPAQRRTFYTALYHTLLAPNLYEDVDGRYRGRDLEIHDSPGFTNYTVFSLWDTFRATHPLFTILEPTRTRDFVETMLAQYREGGRLPVWELAANETDTMIGYHAVSVIADAYVKGIEGFDLEQAYAAARHSAQLDHLGLEAYRRHGYIPVEDEHESVSKTLEYAYDEWCVAMLAKALGREGEAAEHLRRAQAWENLFDPSTKLMRPRQNGGFLPRFDPREVNLHYTEANAWQYGMFVPHDIGGLIARHGGPEAFGRTLDALFEAPSETTGRTQVDITGLIGQYAHGNEPSHHVAYLYPYAGRADRTQDRVRQILDELYTDQPDGLAGNEDCGQMSAWYVLSALGLYPVTPGSDAYVIGAPLFERAQLELESGASVIIEAPGVSSTNRYVQSLHVNGEPREQALVRHAELFSAAGGHLVFEMGPEPRPQWGAIPVPAPLRAASGAGSLVLTPLVSPTDPSFDEQLVVELSSPESGVELHYTLDGSAPTASSPVYAEPLTLAQSTTLSAVALRASDGQLSPLARAHFHRRAHTWPVRLSYTYNPQYHGGGPEGLVDGLRGTKNWRTGGWQGYQGTDFEAIVDLGELQRLRHLDSGYLQDARAWIWMPVEVEYFLSRDGKQFSSVGSVGHEIPDTDTDTTYLEHFPLELDSPRRARYVKVRARNYGTIPDWHPGHGSEAFIFVDELVIE